MARWTVNRPKPKIAVVQDAPLSGLPRGGAGVGAAMARVGAGARGARRCSWSLALFDLPEQSAGLAASRLAGGDGGGVCRRSLVDGVRRFRPPHRASARRRIERASGLAHRPLAALEDRLASGGDDPETVGAVASAPRAHGAGGARLAVRLAARPASRGAIRGRCARSWCCCWYWVRSTPGRDWAVRIERSLAPNIRGRAGRAPPPASISG